MEGRSNITNVFLDKDEAVLAVVGTTCCLSILGSLLITFSYICFKSLRSTARLILVHISLMDLGVAAANLIGLSVYFDGYYRVYSSSPDSSVPGSVFIVPPKQTIQNLCITQAFFAAFFTYGSIAWTVCLSIYLYFTMVYYENPKISERFVHFSYVFSYGMSLLISVWLVATGKLGYSPYNSSGWCSIILVDPATQEKDIYTAIFGYDLWIYLALVLVPIIYLSLKSFLNDEYDRNKAYISEKKFWEAVYVLDYKFMLIPLAFTLLRVWSCIVTILFVYSPESVSDSIPKWISSILLYLAGIGDSGQGLANALLFVLFMKPVRTAYHGCISSCVTRASVCLGRDEVHTEEQGRSEKLRTQFNSATPAERTPVYESSEEFSLTATTIKGSVNPRSFTK